MTAHLMSSNSRRENGDTMVAETRYDEPGSEGRPKGDTPYSKTGAPHWICRGWTENYAPDDAPHQWMHAYYEVAKDASCGICHATEDEPRRWDGKTNPLADPAEWESYQDESARRYDDL